MINTRKKVFTVLVVLLILLLSAGIGLFHEGKHVVSPDIETIGEIEHTKLGGVAARMPDNSAKILFESLLGVKLRGYQSYNDVFETISALRSNEIQVAWFPDVTVEYLLKVEDGLKEIPTNDPTEARVDFALALRKEDTNLRDEINQALETLKETGLLSDLSDYYITNAQDAVKYKPSDMIAVDSTDTLYVGVTGAVWPIDLVDLELKPYGFSVGLMNEIGKLLNKKIEFVTLRNDTAFSVLMGGKIDVLFCYGTSQTTLTDVKNYITTDGYYTMQKYSYIVLE